MEFFERAPIPGGESLENLYNQLSEVFKQTERNPEGLIIPILLALTIIFALIGLVRYSEMSPEKRREIETTFAVLLTIVGLLFLCFLGVSTKQIEWAGVVALAGISVSFLILFFEALQQFKIKRNG